MLGPLLNEYLTGMTDIVFAHDGTVAKIVGDVLHVLFGAPGEQSDHADRAITCALALDAFAQPFRDRRQKKGIEGSPASGFTPGPAIVGNFGGGRFFEYTAYGDTINVAARLEGKVEDCPGPADRRFDAAGQDGGSACFRAAKGRAIRRSIDAKLPGGLC